MHSKEISSCNHRRVSKSAISLSTFLGICYQVVGRLLSATLGQARIGNEHSGNAIPVPYRAPEVILNMKWGNAKICGV